MIIEGRRFKDLIAQEKFERKKVQQKIERENRVIDERKKKEQEYYNRALKYNGMDYYEGKEKILMNNYDIGNNNKNKNKKPQYNYDYYKEHKKDNYINNNKNYYSEDNKIINDNDIEQIKMNIKNSNKHINNQNMYNNNNFNDNNDNDYNPFDDNNNPYPSFSTICKAQNNAGNNNNNINNNNNRNNKNNYN